MRYVVVLLLPITLATGVFAQATPHKAGGSPYYLAASATVETDQRVIVRGLSNLPAGARLYVYIDDYLGYRSTTLSSELLLVDKNGRFEGFVRPKDNQRFKPNQVCSIAFHPEEQPASVVRAIGRDGRRLGDERNPLAETNSGGHYLELYVVTH